MKLPTAETFNLTEDKIKHLSEIIAEINSRTGKTYDNDVAINLYEKFGFKIIHTRKKYYGKKDAYVMERVIENE